MVHLVKPNPLLAASRCRHPQPLTPAQRVQYMHARRPMHTSNPAHTVLVMLRHYPGAWRKPVGPSVAAMLVAAAVLVYRLNRQLGPESGPRHAWRAAYSTVRSTQASRDLRY